MIDFSKQLFRCSSIGALMTNQQGKKDTTCMEEISETAKKELVKIYVHAVYQRDKEIVSKYLDKGNMVEEDSLTLVSRIKGIPLFKNSERFTNDFITGEPDCISPLYDMKSCWDAHSFFEHKAAKKLKSEYDWQIQGYADLIKADQGTVAFCLIDTPEPLIHQEKQRTFYKGNYATMEAPEFIEVVTALEKEMKFDDIPLTERVHEVVVKRSPGQIQKFYDRVPLLREWLNEFANQSVAV